MEARVGNLWVLVLAAGGANARKPSAVSLGRQPPPNPSTRFHRGKRTGRALRKVLRGGVHWLPQSRQH